MYSKQILEKPKHLRKHSLIALIGLSDHPVNAVDPTNLPYMMSQLAVNDSAGLLQVYVEAERHGGLSRFKQDYPSAQVREDGTLENPEQWRVLAFSSEAMLDESTPLDNYYQVRGREIAEITQHSRLKEK